MCQNSSYSGVYDLDWEGLWGTWKCPVTQSMW